MVEPDRQEASGAAAQAVDISTGNMAGRNAETRAQIYAAQALRYRVFYEEMGALPDDRMARAKRDFDDFDEVCDHLLVVDQSRSGSEAVVGTYRLIRRSHAQRLGRFYSASEFDVSNVL